MPSRSNAPVGEERPPRPPNAFILYRSHMLRTLAKDPDRKQPDASKIIGPLWKQEPPHVKKYWYAVAKQEKDAHEQAYPNYKYQPLKKEEKQRLAAEKKHIKEHEAALKKRERETQRLVRSEREVSGGSAAVVRKTAALQPGAPYFNPHALRGIAASGHATDVLPIPYPLYYLPPAFYWSTSPVALSSTPSTTVPTSCSSSSSTSTPPLLTLPIDTPRNANSLRMGFPPYPLTQNTKFNDSDTSWCEQASRLHHEEVDDFHNSSSTQEAGSNLRASNQDLEIVSSSDDDAGDVEDFLGNQPAEMVDTSAYDECLNFQLANGDFLAVDAPFII